VLAVQANAKVALRALHDRLCPLSRLRSTAETGLRRSNAAAAAQLAQGRGRPGGLARLVERRAPQATQALLPMSALASHAPGALADSAPLALLQPGVPPACPASSVRVPVVLAELAAPHRVVPAFARPAGARCRATRPGRPLTTVSRAWLHVRCVQARVGTAGGQQHLSPSKEQG
jgi:hypothetical protein